MKKKTYGNVVKLSRIIMKKGYARQEALEMSVKIFDDLEYERFMGVNVGHTAETRAELIANKEELE